MCTQSAASQALSALLLQILSSGYSVKYNSFDGFAVIAAALWQLSGKRSKALFLPVFGNCCPCTRSAVSHQNNPVSPRKFPLSRCLSLASILFSGSSHGSVRSFPLSRCQKLPEHLAATCLSLPEPRLSVSTRGPLLAQFRL